MTNKGGASSRSIVLNLARFTTTSRVWQVMNQGFELCAVNPNRLA
jgi:hypothetical protein